MAWISLLIAGLFEVVWATTMKLSNGFSHPLWTLATIIGMTISFGGLVLATKHLPSGLPHLDRDWGRWLRYRRRPLLPRPA